MASYNSTDLLKNLNTQGFSVIEGTITDGDFGQSLYNQPAFLEVIKPGNLLSFTLIKENFPQATWHWVLHDDECTSLPFVPFGGPEHCGLPVKDLSLFVRFCLAVLKEKHCKKFTVRLPPDAVYTWAKSAYEILIQQKFSVESAQENHHIVVQTDFEKNLHTSAKRRLRKCRELAPAFALENNNPEEVYRFIESCRKEKGWQLSLSESALLQQVIAFPGRYFFFCLRHGQTIIAATICVLVTAKVLYSYAPAHHLDFNNYSPVILLHQQIAAWAKAREIEILDLGTSMLGNKVNEPLALFKSRMGGIASQKITLTAVFNN